MLDPKFDYLRKENVSNLTQSQYSDMWDKANADAETLIKNYESIYGTVIIDNEVFVPIMPVINWDNEGERFVTRALRKGDTVEDGFFGYYDTFGWLPLCSIWRDKDGNLDYVEEELLFNIYTKDDWY